MWKILLNGGKIPTFAFTNKPILLIISMIHNNEIKTRLHLIVGGLLLLGVVDFVISQLNGSLAQLSFGYLLFVLVAAILMLFAYTGSPLFSFDGEAEMIEIHSGYPFVQFLHKAYYIQRKNLMSFSIKEGFFRKVLVLNFKRARRTVHLEVPITFLNKNQVEALRRKLDIVVTHSQEAAEETAFA